MKTQKIPVTFVTVSQPNNLMMILKVMRGTLVHLSLAMAMLAVSASLHQPTHAQSIYNFGYGRIGAGGYRPLLVVTADLADRYRPLAFSNADARRLIFEGPEKNVNRYFIQNSHGRFGWKEAGIIGPIWFSALERNEIRMDDPAGISRVLRRALESTGFNYAQFDRNADGTITGDELGILIISNWGDVGGATRSIDPSGCLKPAGSSVKICSEVSTVDHHASLMTMCHELSHLLGTFDLYEGDAGLNQDITLMGATIGDNRDDRHTYHLDPWHKMILGWSEPRIRDLRKGGTEVIPATQEVHSNAPVILYDSQRGIDEFFILEYRTRATTNNENYDADVASQGLAIWHILQGRERAVFHEGAATFQRGGNILWSSGNTTPSLRWIDGVQMPNKIFVRPFNAGDASIAVEWLREEEVWVDFNYHGFLKLGTLFFPYNTMAEGVAAVPYGGALKIKAGSRVEAVTINKKVKIEAYGGAVTIGR